MKPLWKWLLKMSLSRLTCLFLITSLPLACKKTENVSQTKYALLTKAEVMSSVLKDIINSGRVNFCLGFPDSVTPDGSALTRLKTDLNDIVNQWNGLLAVYDDWPRKGNIETTFFVTRICQEPTYANINFFDTWTRFNKECTGFLAGSACRSHAAVSERMINMEPNIRDKFTLMHEFGHLLGLGDTYVDNDAKRSEFVVKNQPPSMMNQESPELTDDDRAGLYVVFKILQGKAVSCGADYKQHFANSSGDKFCIPTGKKSNVTDIGTPDKIACPEGTQLDPGAGVCCEQGKQYDVNTGTCVVIPGKVTQVGSSSNSNTSTQVVQDDSLRWTAKKETLVKDTEKSVRDASGKIILEGAKRCPVNAGQIVTFYPLKNHVNDKHVYGKLKEKISDKSGKGYELCGTGSQGYLYRGDFN